jgi:hypothetical protein
MLDKTRSYTGLTRAYVWVLGARSALYLMDAILTAALGERPWLDKGSAVVQSTLITVGAAVGLVWLHRAWARLPVAHRATYEGRRIEPNEAIWKLFIPFYGLYWLFTVNVGLAGAVERHLHAHGPKSARAPSTLAFVACLVELVPFVTVIVSPFLWGYFMARTDVLQAQAEEQAPDARPLSPPSLLRSIVVIAASALAISTVLVLWFLAIWVFLNPGPPR